MTSALRSTAIVLFFVLGTSFFAAVVLLRNAIGGSWPGWWMQVADMPLLLCAMIYGGTSIYRSLTGPDRPSRSLAWTICTLLTIAFLVILTLNFWGLFTNS